MRTRTKTTPVQTSDWKQYYSDPNGNKSQIGSATYNQSGSTESMTDVVTPGYQTRIKRGEIINNNCSYWKGVLSSTDGYYKYTSSLYGDYFEETGSVAQHHAAYHGIGPYSGLSVPDVAQLTSHAKQQALANVDETPYAFMEDLGELGETIRFLKSPGKSLLKFSKDMQKRSWKIKSKYRKSADVALALNDLYLQRRFVMEPLVRSSFDAVDAYADFEGRKRHNADRFVSRGYGNDSSSYSGEQRGYYDANTYDVFQCNSEVDIRVRAYIIYSFTGVRNLSHHLGLRGKDIPTTAWNLVPMSFMVDRLFDISAFSRGVMNLSDPRLSILAAGVTVKSNKSGSYRYTDQVHNNPNDYYSGSVSGSSESEDVTFTRTVWSPSLSDTVPVLRPKNLVKDAQSIADLFSLSAAILARSFLN